MNGQPLPRVHGYPLRLVVPGWVGSASTKWLHTLTVLDAPFKGTYMDSSYRVPRHPVEPGQKMPPDPVSTEAWPVKSMITSPAPNARLKVGTQATVRGRAWVGEGAVDRVEVSLDEGKSWQRATLWRSEGGKYAWRALHLRLHAEAARATSRSSRAPGTRRATCSRRSRRGTRSATSGTAGTAWGWWLRLRASRSSSRPRSSTPGKRAKTS